MLSASTRMVTSRYISSRLPRVMGTGNFEGSTLVGRSPWPLLTSGLSNVLVFEESINTYLWCPANPHAICRGVLIRYICNGDNVLWPGKPQTSELNNMGPMRDEGKQDRMIMGLHWSWRST